MDQPQQTPRTRLRALRPIRRGVRPSRHDPHHAPTLEPATSLLLNPNFLDRLLGFLDRACLVIARSARDEAIQSADALDCFASLAKTLLGWRPRSRCI